MFSQEYIYLNVSTSNLQAFFAVLAYIEENYKSAIFLYDENNKIVIQQSVSIINAKDVKKSDYDGPFKVVNIHINHSNPSTCIEGYFSAPIIFPKKISEKYYKHFKQKEDKIYFRGLLTKSRLIEILIMFIKIADAKAIAILFIKIFKGKKSFKINTKKVFISFTDRGRQNQFKYLDEEYYTEISKYKYIFCPKGDFKWTYRFFEAIQVGSLPISKYDIEIYSYFYYLKNFKTPVLSTEDEMLKNLSVFKSKFNINTPQEVEIN